MKCIEDISFSIKRDKEEWVEMETKANTLLQEVVEELSNLDKSELDLSSSMKAMVDKAKTKLDELNTQFQADLPATYEQNRQHVSRHLHSVKQFYSNVWNTRLWMTKLQDSNDSDVARKNLCRY